MKTTDYIKLIVKACKVRGYYSTALDSQIMSVAGALKTLELANADIDSLETTVVLEQTRYGSKYAPHPAFKVQRDAQASVTRQLKALGLTVADLTDGTGEDDKLAAIYQTAMAKRKKQKIVKPDDRGGEG